MIESITIIGGRGKDGDPEPVDRIDLQMGSVASIVGPTGSGKTTFINDIELFADGDTPSMRRVLINGERPPKEYRHDPSKNPIALITQHTTFLSDLPVGEFLHIHASVRVAKTDHRKGLIDQTIAFANQLTGEAIPLDARMTELSGGQTRALLIADAVVIGNAPIILLDEIENAGIHRMRALELLRRYEKIFVFVTHDPYIALLSDVRIVMSGGAMAKLLTTSDPERRLAHRLRAVDESLLALRERIRLGESLEESHLEVA